MGEGEETTFRNIIIALIMGVTIVGFSLMLLFFRHDGTFISQAASAKALKNFVLFIVSPIRAILPSWDIGVVPISDTFRDPIVVVHKSSSTIFGTAAEDFSAKAKLCYDTFGAGKEDPLIYEEPILPCFLIYVDFEGEEETFSTLVDAMNQTLNLSSVLIIPFEDDDDSLAARYVNLDFLNPDLRLKGSFYIYFSDWISFSDKSKLTPSQYLRYCYLDYNTRKSVSASYLQSAGFFEGFTHQLSWEADSGAFKDIKKDIYSDYDLESVCEFYAGQNIRGEPKGDPEYIYTECGYLSKSMFCCSDKVIICYIPDHASDLDDLYWIPEGMI